MEGGREGGGQRWTAELYKLTVVYSSVTWTPVCGRELRNVANVAHHANLRYSRLQPELPATYGAEKNCPILLGVSLNTTAPYCWAFH